MIGHENDVRLYRQLLRFGVGDYVVAPVQPIAAVEAIAEQFQEGAEERLARTVAFLGARGGVGSSTVALNVAAALGSRHQTSSLLMDLDLNFGTAALDLNLEPTQGMREALDEGEGLDDTLVERLATRWGDNVAVLAAPCQLGNTSDYDAEAIAGVIEAARRTVPVLLLDLPHGWSAQTRQTLLAADEIVLTATPDLAGLRDARNIMGALRSLRPNDAVPRLVLNKLGIPRSKELDAADFRRVLEIEPSAKIPFDPAAFSAAAASGQPVVEAGKGPAALAFAALAQAVSGQRQAKRRPAGIAGWARRLLRGSS